jgi:hypothetical protein
MPTCDIHLWTDSSTTLSNSDLEKFREFELGLGWISASKLSGRPSLRRRAERAEFLKGLEEISNCDAEELTN